MISRSILTSLFILGLVNAKSESVLELGNKRELFVDHYLIETLNGLSLDLKEPVDKGSVLRFDKPWEGRFSAYGTVLKDQDLFRLYYRGIPNAGNDGNESEVTCYAESKDGLHWEKPNLGLFEFNGTTENNIVLANAAPVTHNFCPFIDTNPATKPEQHYKALGGIASSGLIAYTSPDGIHWHQLLSLPVFNPKGWVLDSQNVSFWSSREKCYVLHFRSSVKGIRAIAKSTSKNFIDWTAPEQMIYSDTGSSTPSHHLYTNQTHPYFRARHIYFSTAARFLPGRQVLSDAQARAINVHPKYFKDTSDSVFMTTRGTQTYDRTFLGALIKPGIGAANWVSRSNYPVLNLVQTGLTEMSLYVNQNYSQPSAHLRRYAFRLDGIACLTAPFSGGTWTSKPFSFTGRNLSINFATSAAGSIKIELQDMKGTPLEGFKLEDAPELIGNEIDRQVLWRSDRELPQSSQPVRLHMQMKDAELYSLLFQ